MRLKMHLKGSPITQYAFATAIAGMAVGIQLLIVPVAGPDSYQLLLGAVAASGLLAGTRSGLLTLFLCTVANAYFFLPPSYHSFAIESHQEVAKLALFLLLGSGITAMGGTLHRSSESLTLELEAALAKIKILRGLLRICASCKKIRDDDGQWQQLETYVHHHSEAEFTHTICPDCAAKLYPDLVERP